jgi:two-component system sensor kinase FixL
LNQHKFYKSANEARPTIVSYSALAGLAVALAVALAWYILDIRERNHINKVSETAVLGIEVLIKKDIENRVTLQSGLTQRWGGINVISQADWEASVQNIFKAQPGYEEMAWVDTSMHVRWAMSADGSASQPDIDLRSRALSLAAAQSALDSDNVIFSTPLDTIRGVKSLEVYSPVYRPTLDGQEPDGLLLGLLLVDPFLETILPAALMAEHEVSISINNQVLFSTNPERLLAATGWIQQRRFEIYGLNWQLDVVPKAGVFFGAYSRFSATMLMLLLLFSYVATSFCYFFLTSRRRDKNIRDSGVRLDRLFKNLPGMAYRCHQHHPWPMEFVSEGCEELCNFDRKTMETQLVLWGKLIHPMDRDKVTRLVAEALVDRRQYDIEYRIQTRTGAERWVWDRGAETSGNDGQEPMLEGFITDVTDRKLAELAVVEERAYSKAVVNTAVEGIITIDANGCIDIFNHSAEQMFGYLQEEIRGKNVRTLMPQPYRDQHDSYINHYIGSGGARLINKGRELSAQRKDGSVFPILLSVSEVHAQKERMFVGLIRDISQLKAAENEARQQSEKLAHVERLNTLGEMATSIAHEINQPLTAISLFSQAGKRILDSGKQDKLPEIFDKLSLHAQRAGAIIERIQMMTRQHKSVIQVEDCNTLIKEVVTLAEVDARIRDIVIETNLGKELPLVSVDRVQIQQVILNLLRNGMEAMQSIGCKFGDTILLQTRLSEKGAVEIIVTDCGNGVAGEMIKDVFTPFSTSKEKGMGIGLSISRTIVVAHGGQLNFYNNKSFGATFYFTLPAAKVGE